MRSGDKHGLPNTFSVLSETFDSASCVLSGSISGFLSKHSEIFMSLHVSDQYTGLKETDRSGGCLGGRGGSGGTRVV